LRKLLTPWRWPLSAAAALVLLILLSAGAARFYPRGDLSRYESSDEASRPLVLMGEVVILDDATPPPEPERETPAPEPAPTLLADLWRNYIVNLADAARRPAPVPDLPPLLPPATDFSFLAVPDTSRSWRLFRLTTGINDMRDPWLRQGRIGDHALKAGEFYSRKNLIFNEDWLSSAGLR